MSAAKELQMRIGNELREHRKKQGRTLRDVSACAAISLGYLSGIECGKREPSWAVLLTIIDALGLDLELTMTPNGDD